MDANLADWQAFAVLACHRLINCTVEQIGSRRGGLDMPIRPPKRAVVHDIFACVAHRLTSWSRPVAARSSTLFIST
jgi:hypothetical protein